MENLPSKSPNIVVGRLLTIAASIGRKPGGKALLGLLLEEKDSQEVHFTMTGQGSYRTRARADSPVSQRAHEAWGIMATRQFATTDPMRTFWSQIIPHANLVDASSALPTVFSRLQTGLLIKLGQDEAGPEINADSFDAVITHHKAGRIAPTQITKSFQEVAGVINQYVLVFSFASKNGPWSWDDIQLIVELQGKKIREQI